MKAICIYLLYGLHSILILIVGLSSDARAKVIIKQIEVTWRKLQNISDYISSFLAAHCTHPSTKAELVAELGRTLWGGALFVQDSLHILGMFSNGSLCYILMWVSVNVHVSVSASQLYLYLCLDVFSNISGKWQQVHFGGERLKCCNRRHK